jgi:hypothetical protein
MYSGFEGYEDNDNNTVISITQTMTAAAAGTTATSVGVSGITTTTYSLTINVDIAAAINQLLANQTTIMTQMAALCFAQEPAQHTRRFVARKFFRCHPSTN